MKANQKSIFLYHDKMLQKLKADLYIYYKWQSRDAEEILSFIQLYNKYQLIINKGVT